MYLTFFEMSHLIVRWSIWRNPLPGSLFKSITRLRPRRAWCSRNLQVRTVSSLFMSVLASAFRFFSSVNAPAAASLSYSRMTFSSSFLWKPTVKTESFTAVITSAILVVAIFSVEANAMPLFISYSRMLREMVIE